MLRFIIIIIIFLDIFQATDDRRSDLSEVFYVGQSVRSNIVDVGQTSELVFTWRPSGFPPLIFFSNLFTGLQ